MPMYEYKCPECDNRQVHDQRADRMWGGCNRCGFIGNFKRVFGFALKPMMHEHFNHTVGKPISDMKKFRSELDRAADEASRHSGIEHKYAPVEWGDAQAVGATGDGIHESNVVRSRKGEPLLPEIG